jgi:hypothetical protein
VTFALVAGCRGLLGIETPSTSTDAGPHDGSLGDGVHTDDAAPSPCMLVPFVNDPKVLLSAVDEVAVPANATFAIVAQSGALEALDLTSETLAATSLLGGGFSHVVITPDGLTLIYSNMNMFAQSQGSSPTAWTPPRAIAFPDGVTAAGTPAVLGMGLVMVAQSGTSFVELEEIAGSWSVRAPVDSMTMNGGSISYPALADGGLVLVFAYADGFNDGIYFAQRQTTATKFSLPLPPANRLAAGTLVSPQLGADCRTLLAVAMPMSALVAFGLLQP